MHGRLPDDAGGARPLRGVGWRTLATGSSLAWWLAASVARAQAPTPEGHEEPWAVEIAGGAGGMVSDDQRGRMQFSSGGALARVAVRARPLDTLHVDWIETELRGTFLVVMPGREGAGGVLDFALGVRAAPNVGPLRPYLAVSVGVGMTGELVRATGQLAIGLAVPLGDEVSLGPELGLVHVIQRDDPGASSDAIFVYGGASVVYRPYWRPPPPPPEPTVVPTPPPRRAPRPAPPTPPAPPVAFAELDRLMDQAVCSEHDETVTLLPPVLFDFDAAVLTPAGEVAMFDVLARVSDAPPAARVIIEGHADSTGEDDYNELLAMERATAVVAWLAAHGVDPARLEAVGHGEREPLVEGSSSEALAPNRRVTVRIVQDAVGGTGP